MKFNILRLLFPLAILLAIDFYSFQAVRTLVQHLTPNLKKAIYVFFWSITGITVVSLLSAVFIDFFEWPKWLRTYLFAFLVMFYFAKLMFIPFLIVDDLIRLGKWLSYQFSSTRTVVAPGEAGIKRSEFLSQLGLFFATVPIVSLSYGMLVGGADFKVRRLSLKFPNLPKAFNGLKILQFSDAHVGTFLSPDPFERAVKMMLAEKADIIFFTGDLVNNRTVEINPFMDTFKKVKAPLGVYSILGNHDYGDYMNWDSEEEKKANMDAMYDTHKKLGWKLLKNENFFLERNGERIAVAGVENWGKSSHFPKYGKLNEALTGLKNTPFTILLSHDPSHWEGQVINHPHPVDLMLSGHTHGMQFGIDTKWLKWSPSQYFYKQWAGLYRKGRHHIYVNRGLGYLGYPGRAGIRPEITVITLQSA